MLKHERTIGFVLVLCLAVAAFGIVADDSDSSDGKPSSVGIFSNQMNQYSNYLLGASQTVISSSFDGTLNVTLNTSSTDIESVSMNLHEPFEVLMDKLANVPVKTLTIENTNANSAVSYNIITQSGSEAVINHDAAFDFIMSVLQVMKDNRTLSTVTYNGNITIYDGDYTDTTPLKITINLDSTLRGLFETLAELELIQVEVSQGKVTKITITNNEVAADILGKPSATDLQGKTLIEVVSAFAADGVLAKIVTDSTQQSYVNKICGKIASANKLDEFFDSVFSIEVNSITMITMDFGKPTVSGSDFKALMGIVKDAMSKGTNFDKKVSDVSTYDANTGIISVKPITVKWKSGTSGGATGTAITIDKTDFVFGVATIETLASPTEGGTVTIDPSATGGKYVCWDEITIKSEAKSGYTLKSVSYKIGSGDYVALEKKVSQKFTIPGDGANITITIKAEFSKNSPPGPGPGPTPTEKCTVTFNAMPGGTVSPSSVTVAKGTSFKANANVMSFGITQKATATADAGYIFTSWSVTSGKVESDMTITASFAKAEPVAPIEKRVENGSVYLPSAVVQALGITEPSKLVLTIKKVTPTISIIPDDAVCYEVTLTYNGEKLTTFSGFITVGLKYDVPAGADVKNIKVFFVSDDGKTVENMNATYDSSDGQMEFDVPHLSVFAITQKNIEPEHGKLVSIAVNKAPSKVSYVEGDKFDPTGLELVLKYDDDTSSVLPYKGNESAFGFTPSLTAALKTTDKAVAITYEGKSTTQAISVSAAPEPSGGDNTVLIVVIVIIVLIVIAAAVFFFMKKRNV